MSPPYEPPFASGMFATLQKIGIKRRHIQWLKIYSEFFNERWLKCGSHLYDCIDLAARIPKLKNLFSTNTANRWLTMDGSSNDCQR